MSSQGSQGVPVAQPDISQAEIDAAAETLRSGWLTTGAKPGQFEREFADALGVQHAVAVSSGTAALHLALVAAGVGPGDTVVTTTNTFIASAEAIHLCGADVELADIDYDSMNIDPANVAERLRRLRARNGSMRAAAILPVHAGGAACDMNALMSIAREFQASIVEDASHAFYATYAGRPLGTFGVTAAFSFSACKPITTIEGGMVVTDDPQKAARMRKLRLHGIDHDAWERSGTDDRPWYYQVVEAGYKYNMSNVAAAIGLVQLARQEALWSSRQRVAARYFDAFAGDDRLEVPQKPQPGERHAWHLFCIRLRRPGRDRFVRELRSLGIGTSVHFIPLHLHPYLRNRYRWQPEDFPNALRSYERSVSIPIHSRMSSEDVDRVIAAVRTALDAIS